MKRIVIACSVLAAACGKPYHLAMKGAPNHVEMKATESSPRVLFLARRRSATAVELRVKQLREVSAARTVYYNSNETFSESGSFLWELLEVPMGLITLPALMMISMKTELGPDALDLSASPFLVTLNPFERLLSIKIRNAVTDRNAFHDAPRRRSYNVKLPLEGVTVTYRVVDDAHATIASGTGKTDMFGVIAIEGVDERAVGIEAHYDNTAAVVAIQPKP